MSWLQDHSTFPLQKTWNVLSNKDYIDLKIPHFPHFINHFRGNILLFQRCMSKVHYKKLLLNFKKACLSVPKIPENFKNSLGASEWPKPNIFRLPPNYLFTIHTSVEWKLLNSACHEIAHPLFGLFCIWNLLAKWPTPVEFLLQVLLRIELLE